MKDIHNHLLYEIDDGSKSLNNSIQLLDDLKNRGVTDIVLTPHYIIGTNYCSNNNSKKELMNELQKHTSIKLYLGNEVYIDNNIVEYIENGEISTINNSKYLLMELPLKEKLNSTSEIIFRLRNIGVVPIIAHPERYHYLSIKDLENLIEQGCLLQGNISSIIGRYGKDAKKNLELLLKKHMIHVLGTDIHNSMFDIEECKNELKKIVDEYMYDDIMCNNFDKIVNNKDVSVYEIKNVGSFFKREKIK